MRRLRAVTLCAASSLAVFLGGAVSSQAQGGTTRLIDPSKSRAVFSVTHLYVTKVTGTVPISGGSVVFAPGSSTPSSITATLDASRIDTHDDDRNDSLQGPDWFDTKRFPEWTFTSTSIKPSSDGAFTAEGTVMIHGVSQPVSLAVTVSGGSYHAQAHLDRHAFGMRKTALDGTIGDDLLITIDVTVK